MKIPFSQAELKFHESAEFLKKELQAFRVGRGSLQMIEGIKVEVYGQFMPVNQVANISMTDATLVTIAPWDKSNLHAISKAVQLANIGINPVVDGDIVRLPIPPMTEERRKEYIKMCHEKVEEAKITIRQIRKDILMAMDDDKKLGVVTEDDYKRMEKDLQNKVDKANQEVEKYGKEKEIELNQV
jgi:ribosome recycling factor